MKDESPGCAVLFFVCLGLFCVIIANSLFVSNLFLDGHMRIGGDWYWWCVYPGYVLSALGLVFNFCTVLACCRDGAEFGATIQCYLTFIGAALSPFGFVILLFVALLWILGKSAIKRHKNKNPAPE
jgi:hypothetical protein